MTTEITVVEGESEAEETGSLSPVDEAAAVVTVASAAVELSEQTRVSGEILAAEREAQNIRDNEAWKLETLTLFNSRMEEMEQRTQLTLTGILSSIQELATSIQPTTVVAEEVTIETVEPVEALENVSTETEASGSDADQTRTHERQHRKHRWT